MDIQLKCFANLAERYACGYHTATELNMEEGATAGHVMEASGVPEGDVKVIFVNGKSAEAGQVLADNDSVTLVPATGGM